MQGPAGAQGGGQARSVRAGGDGGQARGLNAAGAGSRILDRLAALSGRRRFAGQRNARKLQRAVQLPEREGFRPRHSEGCLPAQLSQGLLAPLELPLRGGGGGGNTALPANKHKPWRVIHAPGIGSPTSKSSSLPLAGIKGAPPPPHLPRREATKSSLPSHLSLEQLKPGLGQIDFGGRQLPHHLLLRLLPCTDQQLRLRRLQPPAQPPVGPRCMCGGGTVSEPVLV